MRIKSIPLFLKAIVIVVIIGFLYFAVADAQKSAPPQKSVKVESCYTCHDQIKDFHSKG